MALDDLLLWPASAREGLLRALAEASGLAAPSSPGAPTGALDDTLGVELRGFRISHDRLAPMVRSAGPAALSCFGPQGAGLIGVVGPADARGRVTLVGRDGTLHDVGADRVAGFLAQGIEAGHGPAVDGILDQAGLRGRARDEARGALLARRLKGAAMGGGVALRAAPDGAWRALWRDARVTSPLLGSVAATSLGAVLTLLGWRQVGQGALSGRLDAGWVVGWGLVMITGLAMGHLSGWLQGRAAIRMAASLKTLLFRGALRAGPDAWARDGVGGALARVQESQAIEDLATSGGLGTLLSLVDLAVAFWILGHAPLAPLWWLALVVVVGVMVLANLRHARLHEDWTEHRRHLTHMLVERIHGHRTRLTQAHPEHLHDGEDRALDGYLRASRSLDRLVVALGQIPALGFMLLGLGLLGGILWTGRHTPEGLAVSVGGLLWTQAVLARLGGQVAGLVAARTSWRQVAPLLSWARRRRPGPGRARDPKLQAGRGGPLLRARNLHYRYEGGPGILRGVDLTVHAGERVLLTGDSGSGKSTLVGLLAGMKRPGDGVLLAGGLDRGALGERGWRDMVVAAPQFHGNHLFEGSLLFNLLLGRSWPPDPDDVHEAERICRSLGLGPLLEVMPAGLHQTVGESGWQLSHGERSRVFLARALLQGSRLVILDESFGALDPERMLDCIRVAQEEAEALMVVAHP